MILKKILAREDGAAVVIAAFAFISIMVAAGIVIDLGSAYLKASSTQNAADAAAYAAGTVLPVRVNDNSAIAQVQSVAREYVHKNGLELGSVNAIDLQDVVGGKYFGVRVQLKKQVPYDFGPVVGLNGTTLTKTAKVTLAPVTSSSAVVPLGIDETSYSQMEDQTQGQDVVVKYGGGDGTTGFFGALDLDGLSGGGGQDFRSWLAFGYNGVLKAGDVLPVETGNMAGPTKEAFITRYNQCTHLTSDGGCTSNHFVLGCPRIIMVIVYNQVDPHTVKVAGFAPFLLQGLNGNGEIVVSTINLVTNEGETNGTLGGSGDYGLYRARLTE